MDFKHFYKTVQFDIDKEIRTVLKATQGDTKSRGFYVTLIVNDKKISVTNQSLYFYCIKPDGTKVFTEAEKDGDIFRLDLPNQVFSVAGVLKCELTLRGISGEQISTQTFTMRVEKSLQDDSIISEDERGAIDEAFDLIATIEAMDIDELVILLNELEQIEDIRESQESNRESNEALRIALYDDLQSKLATGFFKGEKGDKPNHIWTGTKIKFEKPTGGYGAEVDLKGNAGADGDVGYSAGENIEITEGNVINAKGGTDIVVSETTNPDKWTFQTISKLEDIV